MREMKSTNDEVLAVANSDYQEDEVLKVKGILLAKTGTL